MNSFIKRLSLYFLLKVNNKKQIFIIGDGRSGTTWIADVLNFDKNYMDFFEPFHGRRILKLSNNRLYPVDKDFNNFISSDFRLDTYLRKVPCLKGIRKPNGFHFSGAIIKDISSQLIYKSIQKIGNKNILIIRNPISVAISKEKYGQWHCEKDIKNLLSYSTQFQAMEREYFLKQQLTTKFLEYVFVWCLLHRIVFQQLNRDGVKIVFYENFLQDPELFFEELFKLAGDHERFNDNRKNILEFANKPSKTTIKDYKININLEKDQPWDGEKSEQELSHAYDILKSFKLFKIYRDSVTPKVSESSLKSMIKNDFQQFQE